MQHSLLRETYEIVILRIKDTFSTLIQPFGMQSPLKKAATFLLLINSLASLAQQMDNKLPMREFRINLEAVMYRKLIETSGTSSLFKPRNAPSGILGISEYFRFKNHFALEPCIAFTMVPYSYSYNVELSKDHPLYPEYVNVLNDYSSDYVLPSARLSLFITKEFRYRKKTNLFAGLGININTFPTYSLGSGHSYGLQTGQQDSFFRLLEINLSDEDYETAYWSNLSYSFKIGFSKRNNQGNGSTISLVWNYQPNNIGVGDYSINQGSYKEMGTLKWKNSYLGFCFTKTFKRTIHKGLTNNLVE